MTENEAYRLFNIYMSSDEFILWEGKPEKGHLLSAEDLLMIPFSILWSGGAFTFTFVVLTEPEIILPFLLVGLFFSLIGLYILIGRFIHKAYIRKQTRYVITNKRVFSSYKDRVSILNRHCIHEINLKTYKNGSGNILFEDSNPFSDKSKGFLEYLDNKVQLQNIPDVHSVYKILIQKID